jgi:hypothetical protein
MEIEIFAELISQHLKPWSLAIELSLDSIKVRNFLRDTYLLELDIGSLL